MSNSLRNRTSQAASKRDLTSSSQQQRLNAYVPSRKEIRRGRNPSYPVTKVIVCAFVLLVVVSAFFNEGIRDIPRRSLRALLEFAAIIDIDEQDSIDYSTLRLCINNYNDLPELWKPIQVIDVHGKPKRLFMDENGEPQANQPWSEQETLMAMRALDQALDQIVRYYHEEMTSEEVQDFQPDGINSLLDMAYGQGGLLHRTALKAARDQIVLVATPFLTSWSSTRRETDQDMHEETCHEDGKEESQHDYRQHPSHLENEGSEDSNEGYSEQENRHLENEDGQDPSQENDDEVENRDDIVKKEIDEDAEEKDKDDIIQVNRRRRLNEQTDDTPNSSRFAQSCSNQYLKMKLANYGHYIVEQYGLDHIQKHDPALNRAYNAILASVREMIQGCGTLDRILELDLTSELFEDPDQDSSVVFDYILSAIALVELSTIPDIDFPYSRASWFVSSLWNYLSTYNLKYARDNQQHYWNPETIAHAWLATHIAYLPSGYGRHTNQVQDAPYLYKYIRENFYYAMEHARIDLVSEFVDLIRTYGCTEETDYQLRDGTRFILNKFYHDMDGQWIDLDSSASHYNKIHVPWAGSAAVMLTGDSEPIEPGSYGDAFYAMLRNQSPEDSLQDSTTCRQM